MKISVVGISYVELSNAVLPALPPSTDAADIAPANGAFHTAAVARVNARTREAA